MRRTFELLARDPAHFDTAQFLVFRACLGPGPLLAGGAEHFGGGVQPVLMIALLAFGLLQRRILFGDDGVEPVLFFLQLGNFHLDHARAICQLVDFGLDFGAALCHFGHACLRFAGAILP